VRRIGGRFCGFHHLEEIGALRNNLLNCVANQVLAVAPIIKSALPNTSSEDTREFTCTPLEADMKMGPQAAGVCGDRGAIKLFTAEL